MEFAAAITSKIGEYLVKATVHQIGYLFSFNSIVENLRREGKKLVSARDYLQQDVESAIRNTEEIDKDVQEWLIAVSNVVADVQRLEEEIQLHMASLNGWFPNWGLRYRLSRKAAKKTSVVLKLQKSGKFNKLSHRANLPGIEFFAHPDFIPFESTKSAFDQIIEALKDDNTKMVGLYGTGGVGKTTLAIAVGNKVQEQKIFEKVVIATVSQHPDFKIIQGKVADLLNIKLEEESEEGRAMRLSMRLKNENKILIILDDVWARLDLTIIGIPNRNDHKGCKILLTTRRQQVCVSMDCQLRIALNVLKEEEGLALLKKHAGIDDDEFDSILNDVAKEVAAECKGLPLAFVSVGSALREKDADEWKVVSQKLKDSKFVDIEDVDVDLYACLKLSYDYLKGEDAKLCFLFCSLFPEDYKIDLEDLFRVVGLCLYPGANSIEEARSNLRASVKMLKASCLLLDTGEEEFVKMHDVVRDVALWIASEGKKAFMVKCDMGLTEWPEEEGLEQLTGISLMENNMRVLPSGLVCPKLEILLLGCSESHGHMMEIPDQFFEEMKALKVVTIKYGNLSLKSVESLTNLQSLQLICCNLRDMSSIRKLKNLQILSLQHCSFMEIPEELGELNKLRLLDFCSSSIQRKEISPCMIKRFSRLEELYGDIQNWNVEETCSAGFSELNSQPHLTLLESNVECLPKAFAFPSKLRRYDIRVNWVYSDPCKTTALRIKDVEATLLIIFKSLYQYLELLLLDNAVGCQNIVPSIDQEGLNGLTSLELEDCKELECIIDMSQQQVPATAFSNLVKLSLRRMVLLREICNNGRPPRKSLEKLEILYVKECDSMCGLLPATLLQEMQKLKEVKVESCNKLGEVFQFEENLVLLSSLANLNLRNLPELNGIWKGPAQHVSLHNLTDVKVSECHNLTHLFSFSLAQSLLQLKKLKIHHCERLEQIIEETFDDNQGDKNVIVGDGNVFAFPMLRELALVGLPNLISVCPEHSNSTWPVLQKLKLISCPKLNIRTEIEANVHNLVEELQFLYVESCDHLYNEIPSLLRHGLKNLGKLNMVEFGVQVIFQLESITGDGREHKLSLPSLKEMELEYLPELEFLCNGPTQFLCLQNLTCLTLRGCHRLRHIFSTTLAGNLLQLERLNVIDCSVLEKIIVEDDDEGDHISLMDNHLQPVYFPKLIFLRVERCNRLTCLFHVNVARGLQKLGGLTLTDNLQLEEVFGHENGEAIMDDNKIVMSELWKLSLKELPSLTNFCPVGYHFIFPSLDTFSVKECPRISTIFSAEQNRPVVHAEAEAPKVSEEDVKARFHSETSLEFICWGFEMIQEILPPHWKK